MGGFRAEDRVALPSWCKHWTGGGSRSKMDHRTTSGQRLGHLSTLVINGQPDWATGSCRAAAAAVWKRGTRRHASTPHDTHGRPDMLCNGPPRLPGASGIHGTTSKANPNVALFSSKFIWPPAHEPRPEGTGRGATGKGRGDGVSYHTISCAAQNLTSEAFLCLLFCSAQH